MIQFKLFLKEKRHTEDTQINIMIKINDNFTNKLKPPAKGNKIYWDTQNKGFGIRVTTAGYKSFVYKYIFNGKKKFLPLVQKFQLLLLKKSIIN